MHFTHIKNYFLFIFLLVSGFAASQPARIIFDTDMAPDYDDVGALAILHQYADRSQAKILATVSCNAFETTAPTLSVINSYFGRPGIPIGVVKSSLPNKACGQEWAQYILAKYPHDIKSNAAAEDALHLYRRILAGQPDHSVTVVSVGFFTNLANLLASVPDSLSALTGKELVKRKVKQLVSMATALNRDGGQWGYEFNVVVDPAAAQKVFAGWPTPITLSGFGIGEKLHTGIRLIHDTTIVNSPVQDAYRVALTKDSNSVGRNSWDQTAVIMAVDPDNPWFYTRPINLAIAADGKDTLLPGNKFRYMEFRMYPESVERAIENLMMHQPARKGKATDPE